MKYISVVLILRKTSSVRKARDLFYKHPLFFLFFFSFYFTRERESNVGFVFQSRRKHTRAKWSTLDVRSRSVDAQRETKGEKERGRETEEGQATALVSRGAPCEGPGERRAHSWGRPRCLPAHSIPDPVVVSRVHRPPEEAFHSCFGTRSTLHVAASEGPTRADRRPGRDSRLFSPRGKEEHGRTVAVATWRRSRQRSRVVMSTTNARGASATLLLRFLAARITGIEHVVLGVNVRP